MAQQQKLLEEQRRRMEKALKERQFHDQQKRLKEFTAIGGRKVDVDSFMKSIVGEPDKKQQQCGPVQTGRWQHLVCGGWCWMKFKLSGRLTARNNSSSLYKQMGSNASGRTRQTPAGLG